MSLKLPNSVKTHRRARMHAPTRVGSLAQLVPEGAGIKMVEGWCLWLEQSTEDFGSRALLRKVKNAYGQHVRARFGSREMARGFEHLCCGSTVCKGNQLTSERWVGWVFFFCVSTSSVPRKSVCALKIKCLSAGVNLTDFGADGRWLSPC